MSHPAATGTWMQRFLVRVFTILFGVLSYWMVGFLLEDVRDLPGPDYVLLRESRIPAELREREKALEEESATLQRELLDQSSRQAILRDSTNNAQTTMNQLLQFQRLNLEKNVTPSDSEQQALGESQQKFLANQSEYQRLNEAVAAVQERRRDLEARQRAHATELANAEFLFRQEYDQLMTKHHFWLAVLQLGILTPLLLIGIGLFLRFRESIYVPLFMAFAIAVAAKALRVMHEYFPARYFKYVLIVSFLIIVTKALISLVRSIARPRPQTLLNRFREAYETFLCPICEFPIRRGPLKHLYWTRRSLKKLRLPTSLPPEPDRPYCCPSCSTTLFEECPDCHQVRHSLLPTCEHCGTTRAQPAAG